MRARRTGVSARAMARSARALQRVVAGPQGEGQRPRDRRERASFVPRQQRSAVATGMHRAAFGLRVWVRASACVAGTLNASSGP